MCYLCSSIVALIELYQEVFDMERGVLGKHPEPLDKALKKFLKVSAVLHHIPSIVMQEDLLLCYHRICQTASSSTKFCNLLSCMVGVCTVYVGVRSDMILK